MNSLLQVDQHPLADAGDGQHFLGFADDVFDLLGKVFDGLGGVAVGANAEGILGIDFQQVRSFVEDVGDRLVIHGIKIKQDWVAGPVAGAEKRGYSENKLAPSGRQVFRTDVRRRRIWMSCHFRRSS